MNGSDFDAFRQLVRTQSGLVLTPDKSYLVESRLTPIAKETGFANVAALLAAIRTSGDDALKRRCIDAMATHETFFFRDGTPFRLLEETLLPRLLEARKTTRTLRIWCAACSSGQEPYSIAILLREASARLPGWRTEIVATDMSEAILAKARSGLYSDFEVKRGLTEQRLNRWFKREDQGWRISPELQQAVSFRPHNLLTGTAGLGVFDVIFCRNVLIYLDVDQKRTVLGQLARALAQDGGLFLGSAETVLGVTDAFELTRGASGLFSLAQAAKTQLRA